MRACVLASWHVCCRLYESVCLISWCLEQAARGGAVAVHSASTPHYASTFPGFHPHGSSTLVAVPLARAGRKKLGYEEPCASLCAAPPSAGRAPPRARVAPAHCRHRTAAAPLSHQKVRAPPLAPLFPAALCTRANQRDDSPLTRPPPPSFRRLLSRVVSAVTRSARSSGRSSPMSTASTPPVPTTATPTCSWSASTCTTTRRPAAATCPVTF